MKRLKLNIQLFAEGGDSINAGEIVVTAKLAAEKFHQGTQQVEKDLDSMGNTAIKTRSKLDNLSSNKGAALRQLRSEYGKITESVKKLETTANNILQNKGIAGGKLTTTGQSAIEKAMLSWQKTKQKSSFAGGKGDITATIKDINDLLTYEYNLRKSIQQEIEREGKSLDTKAIKEQRENEKRIAELEKIKQKAQEAAEAEAYRQTVLQRFQTIGTSNTANAFFQSAYADSIARVTDEKNKEAIETQLLNKFVSEEVNKTVEEINLRRQLAQIIEQNSTAYGKFKTILQGVNTVQKGVEKGFSKFVQGLKSRAVTIRIVGGVIRQVWNQLSNMFEEAAGYVESVNLYTIALGEYAAQGTKWAQKISDALYLDPKNIMQYTGAFFNLVQGLGVASDAAYTMSTNLTQLSYDMSSYLNIDVESAHDKLQSAITGQSRAVASAGIAMQVASLQELAYSMGITKTVATMTQAEKTYLRYIQIMRSTANMQGDLARTIITPENAVRVLKNQFTLLARAIGNVFIPIIMKAIPYIMAITKVLQDLAQRIAALLGVKIGWSSTDIDYSGLTTVDMYMEDIGDTASSTASKIKKAADELGNLAAFDELNVVTFNDDTSTGSGRIGGGGGGSVLPQLEEAISGYDMLQGLTQQFDKQVENATKNLDKFKTVVERIFAIFVAWKALKFAGDIIALVDKIKAGSTAMGGLGSVASLLFKSFKGGKGTISDVGYEMKHAAKETVEATNATSKFKSLLPSLLEFVGGATLSLASMALEYKNVKNQALDYMKTGKEMNGLLPTLGVAGATAGGALAGSVFGPVGTVIGGLVGAIGGVTAAWGAAESAIKRYNAEMMLFGNISVNAEQWTSIFDGVFESSNRFANSLSSLNSSINSHYEATQNAIDSLDLLSYKYGLTGTKISDTDSKKIMSALETITTETTGMIDDTTDKSLLLWKDTLENMSGLSKQQQEKMLNRIVEYGNDQKTALKEAQDNITKTYNNAIKTRGYLTDQERVYIQTQLQKIRELTKQEMSKNQTEIEYYKTMFADRNKKLDTQSYKDFMEVYKNYAEEQKQQIQTNYNERLNDAKRLSNGVQSVYDEYAIAAAQKRDKEEKALQTSMDTIKTQVLSSIGETYINVLNKTDEESVKIRNEIEGILKELNIDPSELIQKFGSAGTSAGTSTRVNFENAFGTPTLKFKIEEDTTNKKTIVIPIEAKITQTGNISSGKKSWSLYQDMPIKLEAGGGYLDSGDLFFANENGVPEYITSIGNKSAVVNQQQMVTALTNAIVEGLSNMNAPQSNEPVNIYIGNDKVYSGFINYAKRQNNIYGTNVIRV